MLTLLRRIFIRDYQKTKDESVRMKHGILAAWLGLIINVVLVALKLTVAFLLAANHQWIFPVALIADAVNNASDMASNIVTLIGFVIAGKPADSDHPFGHERVEYVAGLIVSISVLFAAVELIISSVESIISGSTATYTWTAVIVFGASIILKLLQGWMNLSLSKVIQSSALKATAIDSFTDCIATSSVVVSAILGITLEWTFLDAYFGIAVALFIGFSAIQMIKETTDPLIGKAFSKADIKEITSIASKHKEILGIHDVRIHRYGPTKTFISLHAEVDADSKLAEIHDIIDQVETQIGDTYHAEVTIHMDPVSLHDNALSKKKRKAEEILFSFSKNSTLHDFRILHEGEKQCIEFDIILPYEESEKEKDLLESFKQAFPEAMVKVSVDHPYAE